MIKYICDVCEVEKPEEFVDRIYSEYGCNERCVRDFGIIRQEVHVCNDCYKLIDIKNKYTRKAALDYLKSLKEKQG